MAGTPTENTLPANGSLHKNRDMRLKADTDRDEPDAGVIIVATATSKLAPDARPHYASQFSTTTSLILDKMKLGSHSLASALSSVSASAPQPDAATFEDAKSRLVQSMSSTLPMPSSASPASHESASATLSKLSNASLKRKRESDPEKVDFTQNTIALPWVDKSKRLRPQPKLHQAKSVTEQSFKSCSKCGGKIDGLRGPSTSSSSECATCKAEQEASIRLQGKVNQEQRDEVERLRRKRLAALPKGVFPAKPELVGFNAGRASDSARTEYFSSMKKTDMLNMLSLCDQLKPQLLVDILVSVSKRHPDLPIFSSPDWESNLPTALRSNPNLATRGTRADGSRYGHSLVNSKAKQKPKATKKILKRTRVIEVTADVQNDDEDVLPQTWPKANEGLYAKLPPEAEDRSFLEDENDEESFSHFMVNSVGKQIIGPVGA